MKKDLYKLTDYLILVSVVSILIVCFCKNSSKYIAIIPCLITCTVFAIQAICGKTYCKNGTNETIYAKPEHGEAPIEISANGELYGIDGVNIEGRLYKACDGTHIIVEKDGTITNTSFTGKLLNTIRGGYKDKPPKCFEPLMNH